jgi:hypothetical protein
MNFEHTDDRRMLMDSLNRFVSEQYGADVRTQMAQKDTAPSCMHSWLSWEPSAPYFQKR